MNTLRKSLNTSLRAQRSGAKQSRAGQSVLSPQGIASSAFGLLAMTRFERLIQRFLKTSLAALSVLFLSSCAERSQMPQHAFEGTIVEVIQVPGLANLAAGSSDSGGESNLGSSILGALSNVTITMHVRGDKVASNVAILGGMISMTSIIDRNARTLTMLLPNHTAVVQDLREFDSARRK